MDPKGQSVWPTAPAHGLGGLVRTRQLRLPARRHGGRPLRPLQGGASAPGDGLALDEAANASSPVDWDATSIQAVEHASLDLRTNPVPVLRHPPQGQCLAGRWLVLAYSAAVPPGQVVQLATRWLFQGVPRCRRQRGV